MQIPLFLRKSIRQTIRFITALRNLPWGAALRQYDKNANIVLWMYNPGRHAFTETPLDLTLLAAIVESGQKYAIRTDRKIGNLFNKTIFLNLSNKYNVNQFSDYVDTLIHLVKQLEKQGNKVFYSSYEIAFWENKAKMHQLFYDKNIHCPATWVFDSVKNQVDYNQFSYPVLVKEEHSSGSKGIHKIVNAEALSALNESKTFKSKNRMLLVQELLNMHRDMRVILVGEEIVLHYWRINHSEEWKPTSTGHGSSVDFISFPEKWRNYIIETFKKTGLITGAFDIAWQNDDLETEPYILEVSPSYDPNPPINLTNTGLSYGQYKKKIRLNNTYDKLYINVLLGIKKKYVMACLQSLSGINK